MREANLRASGNDANSSPDAVAKWLWEKIGTNKKEHVSNDCNRKPTPDIGISASSVNGEVAAFSRGFAQAGRESQGYDIKLAQIRPAPPCATMPPRMVSRSRIPC